MGRFGAPFSFVPLSFVKAELRQCRRKCLDRTGTAQALKPYLSQTWILKVRASTGGKS